MLKTSQHPDTLCIFKDWLDDLSGLCPLCVNAALYARIDIYHKRPFHTNPNPRPGLEFIAAGKRRYQFREAVCEAGPGTLVVIGPAVPYAMEKMTEQETVVQACNFTVQNQDTRAFPSTWLVCEPAHPLDIEQRLIEVHRCIEHRGTPVAGDLASTLLLSVLLQIVAECEDPVQDLDPRIERACNWMEAHPECRLSVADMASHAHLSVQQFVRLFRAQLGTTPKQWHLTMRCRYAQGLLHQGAGSVQDVAKMLGYADAFTFSRQFKTTMGYPPSACMP